MSGWRPVVNALSSVKLALFLIAAITTGSILGATVVREAFSSWWFLSTAGAFLINACCCTLRQLSRTRTRVSRVIRGDWEPSPFYGRKMVLDDQGDPEQVGETVAGVLRAGRYRVRQKSGERGSFYWGSKCLGGCWGIIVFHLGLLVVVIGGFTSLAAAFRGAFFLLEGEVFTDRHDGYVTVQQGAWYPQDHRNFQIRLDEVVLTYNNQGLLRDYTGRVTILENGKAVKQGTVSGPAPLHYRGMIIYKKLYGYAPGFTVTAPGGQASKFRVALDTSMHGEVPWIRHEGDFRLPGTLLDVEALFYPDMAFAWPRPDPGNTPADRPGPGADHQAGPPPGLPGEPADGREHRSIGLHAGTR